MTEKKTRKNHLIAVRLSDQDYDRLQERAASAKGGMPVSTFLRDLIHNAADPLHEREILASVRKMQTDLSFCIKRIERSKSRETVSFLLPILTEIRDTLLLLVRKEGGLGHYETGTHERK